MAPPQEMFNDHAIQHRKITIASPDEGSGPRTPPDTPVARTRPRRATPARRRSALKARAPIAEAICTPQTPQYLASMDTRSSSIVAPSSDGKGAMLFSRAHLRSPSSGMLDWKPRSFNVLRACRRGVEIGRRASWNNGSFRERAAGVMACKSGAGTPQQLSPLPRSPARPPFTSPTVTSFEGNMAPTRSPNGRAYMGKARVNRSATPSFKTPDAAVIDSGNVYKLRPMPKGIERDSDQETARSSSQENSPSNVPTVTTRGTKKHEKGRREGGGDEGAGGAADPARLSSMGSGTISSTGIASSGSSTPRRRFRRTLSKGTLDSSAISAAEFAGKMAGLASDVVSVMETRQGTGTPKRGYYRGRKFETRPGASAYAVHTSGR